MISDNLALTASEFALYLEMELGRGKNTRVSYLSDIKLFSNFLRKHKITDFKDVKVEDISKWIAEVARLDKPTTQSRKLSAIKALAGYLIEEKIWEKDLSALISRPKVRRNIPHVLSISQVDALLNKPSDNTFEGIRDTAMLELMYSSGLRVSELCGLKLSDIDFEEGIIRVRGKGEKTRLVPVGKTAMKRILEYRDALLGAVKKVKGSELFITKRGKKLSRKTFWFNIKKYAAQLGLAESVKPHILRHSFATHLLQNGANLVAIKEMLGHADLSTTQIYTSLVNGTLFKEHALRHPRSKMNFNYGDRLY